MTTFSIEGFAAECKRAMACAANRELAAKTCLEKMMQENDPTEIVQILEAVIPAGADVGEMIVHNSPELTMLYARAPARFQSGIHNHTVFACMGQLVGNEISTLYRKAEDGQGLTVTGTLTAHTGSVVSLPADAIHHIENPDSTTARSLHLYGGDFKALGDERSLWDTDDHEEKTFSFQELLVQSIKTMKADDNQIGLQAVAKAIPATRALIDA
jgi:predicted metal-dependent enzyme (double-stranded beta helix superfamily)